MKKLALLFPILASTYVGASEHSPCSYLKERIEVDLSYYTPELTDAYMSCIEANRICYIEAHEIGKAELIYKMTYGDPATHVIVQSPKNEETPNCLIASFSGGSSASWSFSAFKIVNENAIEIPIDSHGNGEFQAKGAALYLIKI